MYQNASDRSGGLPDVEGVQSTTSSPAEDRTIAVCGDRGIDQPVVESLMVSLGMIVLEVRVQDSSEMSLANRDDSGQALSADRAYEPLRVGVEVRTSCRKSSDAHT